MTPAAEPRCGSISARPARMLNRAEWTPGILAIAAIVSGTAAAFSVTSWPHSFRMKVRQARPGT